MKNIVHWINLERVGGVERLFESYIKSSSKETKHQLISPNAKIHEVFQPLLKNFFEDVKCPKYCGGVKLPKFLRKFNINRIARAQRIDTIVYWNDFNDFSFPDMLLRKVFYDHGFSWRQPDTKSSRLLSKMDLLIASSYACKRMLESNWNSQQPIKVISNPVRSELIPQEEVLKAPLNGRALQIGVVGRLVPCKAHVLALHTVSCLLKKGVNTHLSIAGDGEEAQFLKNLSRTLGIEKNVSFLGFQDHLQDVYGRMDLLLNLSLRESFGLVVFEAMANGCIPIVPELDGAPELVKRSQGGICIFPSLPAQKLKDFGGSLKEFNPYSYDCTTDSLIPPRIVNPSEVAEAIINLISDESKIKKMRHQGWKFVKEEMNISHYVESFNKCIES
jgi:glycosyltransferase involved in cell wall biosynthesis